MITFSAFLTKQGLLSTFGFVGAIFGIAFARLMTFGVRGVLGDFGIFVSGFENSPTVNNFVLYYTTLKSQDVRS